jgi:Leucine-rich repeat (LRR) protein
MMSEAVAISRIQQAREAGATKLSLSGLGLTRLPEAIGDLVHLKTLDLSENLLTTLPPAIGGLTSLERLFAWINEITELPKEIGQLANLWMLNLYDNRLTTLPVEIGRLTTLRRLIVWENRLEALPEEIGQLANLQRLFLNHNQLTGLPPSIGDLKTLQALYLSGNALEALPVEIGGLENLQALYIASNRLTALPESIGRLSCLETLSAEYNQLEALPKTLGQLGRLKMLNLCDNQLKTLPPEMGRLDSLVSLNLYGNQLTSLPASLCALSQLEALCLASNRLSALPEAVGDLDSLRELYLGHNQLPSLPSKIGTLGNLKELSLSHNRLTGLPASLGGLKKLERLFLNHNKLTSVPRALGDLPDTVISPEGGKPKGLHIEENPLPKALFDALNQGSEAFRDFLSRPVVPVLRIKAQGECELQELRAALGAIEHAHNSCLVFDQFVDRARALFDADTDERPRRSSLDRSWPATPDGIAAEIPQAKRMRVRGDRLQLPGSIEITADSAAIKPAFVVIYDYVKKRLDAKREARAQQAMKLSEEAKRGIKHDTAEMRKITQERILIDIYKLDLVNQFLKQDLDDKQSVLRKADLPEKRIRQIIRELIEMPTKAVGPFVDRGIIQDMELIHPDFEVEAEKSESALAKTS